MLFRRIFLTIFLVIVILVVVIAHTVEAWVVHRDTTSLAKETQIQGELIARAIENGYQESNLPFESLRTLALKEDFLFWWITDASNTIEIASNEDFFDQKIPIEFRQLEDYDDQSLIVDNERQRVLFRKKLSTREREFEFWLATSLRRRVAAIRGEILRAVFAVATIALFVVSLVIFGVVRRVMQPIDELVDATHRLGDGDLGFRVEVNSEGEVKRLCDSFNQMADQIEQANSKLYSSQEQYRNTIDSLRDCVLVVNQQGRILLVNEKFRDIFHGQEPLEVDASLQELLPDQSETLEEKCQLALSTGLPQFYEFNSKSPSGTKRFSATIGASAVDRVVVTLVDLTDKQRVDRELARIDKLESLGVLAGGIAHDFNNMLTNFALNVSLTQELLNAKAPAARIAQPIERSLEALETAKSLTGRLLTFSKGGEPRLAETNVANLLRDTLEFALAGKTTDYQLDCSDNLWNALCDADQIMQVFNNIALNAIQAMPNGGHLRVQARNHIQTAPTDAIPLEPGKYLRIDFEDNGPGIAQSILPAIFDPFFTTKQAGSGLGLATSFSIVRAHDGFIGVNSNLGEGATFSVYLPTAKVAATAEQPDASQGLGPIDESLNVLLIDDDELLIQIGRLILQSQGAQVAVAQDEEEALEAVQSSQNNGEPFQVAIIDLTIRGSTGGVDLLKKIRAIDPAIIAVVSSGYSDAPALARPQDYGFADVLPKPYTLPELQRVLNSCLSRVKQLQTEPI